jgi:hypothetical protein
MNGIAFKQAGDAQCPYTNLGRFFTEEINEKVRIKRRKVKFKNGRFNEFCARLFGVAFQVVGYPFYGSADIVS